ncbi:MAG: SRPBCC family protein [Bacteroidales bacterium]|nr:SRPBCC family protein [Bacteroidales bacterium]
MSRTNIKSKKGIVGAPQANFYMTFTDPRNIVNMLPEDKRQGVEADFDTATFEVQGMKMGIRVSERVPYSRIVYSENGAPFVFDLTLHFDATPDPFKTEFSIDVDAEIPMMLKPFVVGKVEEALNTIVDALVSGKMPDLSNFK